MCMVTQRHTLIETHVCRDMILTSFEIICRGLQRCICRDAHSPERVEPVCQAGLLSMYRQA